MLLTWTLLAWTGLALFTLVYLYKYAHKECSFAVKAFTFIGWFMGFSIIAVLPVDVLVVFSLISLTSIDSRYLLRHYRRPRVSHAPADTDLERVLLDRLRDVLGCPSFHDELCQLRRFHCQGQDAEGHQGAGPLLHDNRRRRPGRGPVPMVE